MELQLRVKSIPGAAGPEHNRSSRGRFGSMDYKVRQAFEWVLSPETASVGVDVSLGTLLSWLLQLELIQPVFLVRSKKQVQLRLEQQRRKTTSPRFMRPWPDTQIHHKTWQSFGTFILHMLYFR